MKSILLRELAQDIAEDIIEIVCASRINVTFRVEKGMSNTTVDGILQIYDEDVEFSIYQSNNIILFQFEDEDEMFNFEVNAHYVESVIIR